MKRQPRYKPGDKIGGRYQVHKALMGGWEKCICVVTWKELRAAFAQRLAWLRQIPGSGSS